MSVYLTCAYQKECAVGPQYWCKSFQNAQDCGALTHCTDTIWIHDAKYQNIDSTTKCDWCEKMMENTQRAIENIRDNPVCFFFLNDKKNNKQIFIYLGSCSIDIDQWM